MIYRMFCLSFHHFDDLVARRVLANTIATSEGFAILEMQDRRILSMLFVSLGGVVSLAMSWLWFWGSWSQLFFTYVIPILPAVLVFDGQVSCLRVREFRELLDLIDEAVDCPIQQVLVRGKEISRARTANWILESGRTSFLPFPGANIVWITGRRIS
jgi:hypothetical protein